MKQIIYALVALFLLAEISASYDGWIYNGKQFSYNGADYDVSVSKGGESLLLLGTNTLSIPLRECELIEFGKVCYNISYYDKDMMEYRAYIYIYDMKPDIRITRTASQTALNINDKSVFTVTLTNKGEKGDISFTDRLPDGAKIISVDNAEDEGNTVSWNGEMKKGEVREISYEIKAVGKIDSSTKAEVSYFDGFETKKVFSDAIKLTCSPEIEMTITTDKDKYEIGENVNITVFMKNNGKRRVFNFTIATPGKLVKRPTDVTDEGWSGSLENKTLKFVIRPKETGVNTISVRLGDEMLEKSILIE
ncbi:MAG: DUF11 domain-containing protein, partial [Candidatus Woesearchaeota archaeon]|nr:DUF11 domain-containing protein [Candidatus Woesearchaeota archaeon]